MFQCSDISQRRMWEIDGKSGEVSNQPLLPEDASFFVIGLYQKDLALFRV